jgi:DNA-binding SARP family transcriptional activator
MRLVMNTPGSAATRTEATTASARLLLRAVGRLAINDEEPIDLEPKDALLLAYLAVEGPTPRGRLAALLWPGVDEERARGNLRQRLLRLKRTTGVELVAGNPQAQLASWIAHDLAGAHELLAGIELEHAGGLSDWLAAQRERRHRGRAESLAAAIARAEAEGDLAAALECANVLLDLDPVSEQAHRHLMKLHYLRGDVAAAVTAYERCRQVLQREFGIAPSAATESLRASLGGAMAPLSGAMARQPVPVTVLRPPRLIGRDAEWAALQAAWDSGESAVVLGEAGMGKTRLVTDFARARGPVAVASARPGDERVVYALATRLLRQLPREALAAADAAVRRELARLLPEYGDAEPIRSEQERARFYNALSAVLELPSIGLQGVVIDDLHFADAASVELVQYLSADSRLRWVFTGRPAEQGPAAHALVEAIAARAPGAVLHLAPLTLAQITEFIASLGIDGVEPDQLAPVLMRHTGGNPLFALETVKTWLAHKDGGSGGRLPAVANVGALISRRIGHLSQDAVRLARCAAVAGQDFSAEVAAHVLGVRPLDLADAWSELETAQVFRDGAFAHDLIYDAALASVPPPIARQLHGEVALYVGERNGDPARVAGHWLAAEQWNRAAAALMEAAARSRAACRWREAAAQLTEAARCFALADDAASRFEALLARSAALVYCDLGDDTLACVRSAQESAVTDEQRLRASIALIEVLAQRGDSKEVVEAGMPAVALARSRGDRMTELRLAVRVSGSLSNLQRIPEALALLEPLQDWTDAHCEPHDRAEFYMALGFALDLGSRLSEAVRALETAAQIAREAGLKVALSEAMSNLASTNAKLGRVRRAAELGRQAVELIRGEGGMAGRPLQSQAMLAHRLRDLGRFAESLPLFEESLAHFSATGSRHWVATTAHRLALTWMQLGQYARAQRILSVDPGDTSPRGRAMWAVSRAELARLSGPQKRVEALEQIRLALQLLGQWPDDGAYRIATLFATAIIPPEEGEPLATDLAAWANARERFGTALAAHVRAAGCALEQGASRRALPHIEAALRLAPDFEMDSMYRGELWLTAYRTYCATGDLALAQRMLADGCAWVHEVAERYVPSEFRDSFLDRNQVNRQLLTSRSRAGKAS